MSDYTIYHNPRCSKSRETLKLLEENGIEPKICLYLKDPLSADIVANLVKQLGVPVRDIIRTSEAEYKDNGLSDSALTDQQLLDAIVEYPKLLQRPIVVKGDKAVIGRPPESVLELIK